MKYNKITKNIFVLELYIMIYRFDIKTVFKLIIKKILDIKLLFIIICID